MWRTVTDTFSSIAFLCSFKDSSELDHTQGNSRTANGRVMSNLECEEVNNPHDREGLLP